MIALLSAGADAGSAGVGFDWVPLAVPFIAGVSAIATPLWSTRGETSALRKLKAMNDVLEKMPEGQPATLGFAAARDLLAERVATRVSGPSLWSRLWRWVLGVVIGVLIVLLFYGLTLYVGISGETASTLVSLFATFVGLAVSVLIGAGTVRNATLRAREAAMERAIRDNFERAQQASRPDSVETKPPAAS